MSDKKRGRPAKGNEMRVTVRLPDNTVSFLESYGAEHEMTDKAGKVNLSDVIRTFLDNYNTAYLLSNEVGAFRNGAAGLTKMQEAVLEEYRRSDTTESLLNEIFASTNFMTSTVWCNTAYSGHLYQSEEDKKKVADELRKSANTIDKLFYSLADSIEQGQWDKASPSVRQK